MQMQVTGSADSVDYTHCPLPKTHRRLVEAHILWHQALEHYQDPEAFRANLNALIQAIRNVTFILQSEKHLFPDFDDWYLPWQKRLKLDVVCVWVQGARTTIVHQGELDSDSTAVVRLVTWQDHLLLESSVPPSAPSSLILRNLDLMQALSNIQVPPADLKGAAIQIERRWVVAELKDREILGGLAQAYGLIAGLVLDAHVHLMNTACISTGQAQGHFPSSYDRTGTLPCMAMGPEARIHRFDLETGKEFKLSQRPLVVGDRDRATAAKRYGFGESGPIAQWEGMDPIRVATKITYIAKRMLSKDKALVRVMYIRNGHGKWRLVRLDATNRVEKHLLIRTVARLVETTGADALIDVGEVWLISETQAGNESLDDVDSFEHIKGRREALQITVATREGFLRTELTEFKRGPFGGIKLGDTRRAEKNQAFYLQPVFEVWRQQGFRKLADGHVAPYIWEPDPLDTCLCGGPKRFGECCGRLLNDRLAKQDIEEALDAAQEASDFEQAEVFARAALAQYVIWTKQHTAMGMNVAPEFYREMVAIDTPALDAHVARLHRLMTTNQHAASLLPQLRYISTVIGVPDLSVRIKSRVAQLLLASGEYSKAGEELRSLGDLDQVKDTLALILAGKLFELSAAKTIEILRRAVAQAFTDEEKQFAQIELISQLLAYDQPIEALALVDSLVSECRQKESAQGRLLSALSLRAEITQDPKDWEAAKKEFEAFMAPEHREQLAIMLIEHGDIPEAETTLSEAVRGGDPVAQLLAVDTRLRSGRIDAAYELLKSINQECITDRLRYPYAATCAHVAVATGDDKLKSVAAEHLREIPSAGTRLAAEISEFLKALSDNSGSSRRPRWAVVRDFLKLSR
jgi:tetratricopeptide (TPR) repeat protein